MDYRKEMNDYKKSNQTKSSLVSVLDNQLLTSVKSPDMETLEDIENSSSIKFSPYKKNDNSKTKSPRVISNYQYNSILPLLGEKYNTDNVFNQTLSPSYSNRSAPRSPACLSVSSEGGQDFDYMRYYNPRSKDRYEYEDQASDKHLVSKLERQLEKQAEMIEILLGQMKQQTVSPKIKIDTPSKANYTIPSSEPVKVSNIPKYEDMNPEEIAKYEAKFRNNFQQLINSYPKWNIETPQIGIIPLRDVHIIYEDVVKTIVTYQTAMKFKVGLVMFFAGIEYIGYKRNKIRAFKNFTKIQVKTIHKHDCYLLSFAKSLNAGTEVGGSDEWPSWLKFLTNIGISTISFASIQGAANSMGWNAPELILHEADKFVSPSDGPAKLKSDGISEVPVPPEGLQDPNEIIKQGLGLWETYEGMTNPQQAEPVNTKQKEKDDYDDYYE